MWEGKQVAPMACWVSRSYGVWVGECYVWAALQSMRFPESHIRLLEMKGSGSNLLEWLAIFPTCFPTDFLCEKLAQNVTSGNHMTIGFCIPPKCKLVTKCSDHDHLTTGGLEFWEPIVSINTNRDVQLFRLKVKKQPAAPVNSFFKKATPFLEFAWYQHVWIKKLPTGYNDII